MRTLTTVCFLLFSAVTAWAQPNFVVIMTDDQDDTGSMNYMAKVHSLLAEHGITFTNSFVNFSLCCPSRASFLTGQAAHNHGVKSNSWRKGGGWPAFRDKEKNSLPVWLQAAGYRTALIGRYLSDYHVVAPPKKQQENRHRQRVAKQKKHKSVAMRYWRALLYKLGYRPEKPADKSDQQARRRAIAKLRLNTVPRVSSTVVPPGWDLWFVFALDPSYYNFQISENGRILQFGASDYSADVFRDRAVQFIKDQKASEPFFLYIPLKAPHRGGFDDDRALAASRHANLFTDAQLPNLPAVNEEDVSDKPSWVQKHKALNAADKKSFQTAYQTRLQALQAVDDLVEAVVNALRSTGELDDTFIIFTSDNGFLFGEHRLRGKVHVYEGSIRVPLVIRGPGVPEDQTRSQLVNNLDVVATIEQLAGVTPGVVPDGRSLVPLFSDANAPWRSAILVEGGHDLAKASKRFVGVRTGTKKYVKYDDGFEELYDLSADPYELENKAGDASYASDLASLRATHDRLKDCAGESCWVP